MTSYSLKLYVTEQNKKSAMIHISTKTKSLIVGFIYDLKSRYYF